MHFLLLPPSSFGVIGIHYQTPFSEDVSDGMYKKGDPQLLGNITLAGGETRSQDPEAWSDTEPHKVRIGQVCKPAG